ncbi:MAG: hypothetical protein AB7O37_17705 [Vicinamibacteria bacterium]
MNRRLAATAALLALAAGLHAAQPQFWRIEGARDFLDGELEGVAVDSQGRLRLALAARSLPAADAPAVWSLARDAKGALYAGSGHDGRIFRLDGELAAVFHDSAELEVHALAFGPDGRLYAGTSPDGKVYAIDAAGKAETFYDPSDKYIWALVFDRQGNLFVGTGLEAKVHKVDPQGQGSVVLTSPESHVMSLAIDEAGFVYAGSAPGGIVYRIDSGLRVGVVHDSAYREIKAIGTGRDGAVYVAAVDGEAKAEPARAPAVAPLAPQPAAPVPEGFQADNVAIVAPAAVLPAPRAAEPSRGPAKGAVLRIAASGDVDTLWSSPDDVPQSLLATEDGVLVGTGNKGKLFRVRDDRSWSMETSFAADQVTALLRDKAGLALATSNPGRLYALEGKAAARGSFVSKVKDAETLATWGRIRWDASLPAGAGVEVRTRTGNTSVPDSTWSEWSAPYPAAGQTVAGDKTRFIQVKAVLAAGAGGGPVLEGVHAAYLQRNLRPIVQTVTVHPPGEVYQKPLTVTGEIEILGLEPGQGEPRQASPPQRPLGAISPFGRRLYQRGLQTFSWRAEDPNGDALVYNVDYRAIGDDRWRPLRQRLADAVLTWDTSTVPNGRYVVRVTAADAASNPDALALTGERESAAFDVDNTPPVVSAALVAGRARVRAEVKDDSSPIRRAEYALSGGRWQEIHPQDGINDALEEAYEFDVALEPGAAQVVVVRATDQLGNVGTARVEVSGRAR